ncbi:MAG: LL-diaminopimelate aminotransferase [Clostridia bacterium]|jgi:LL-diaminopimelate aminotransferase|nr:LL-diaminopimelate aminotransferase [Clostridia bacterium]NLV32986.1 LL-diaminopimelate aminotransferase [Clostridiaceae bacterium]OQB52714.1 MAG: LL-diaminopimelate aminotransferase [Firmicutes bacterium ADurb.Bin146]MDD4502113.1 LL-diaminopimelate aminotransferase [Clostridia bacterium]HQM95432.1 LL-diaminopimelate aminotransferase [Clostridia bacterium]
MARVNENYSNLKQSYLFKDIATKVAAYKKANPDKKVISLGIGDVTLPLPEKVVEALKEASDEMGKADTFRGYAPDQGYDFLREKISEHYRKRNVNVDISEIFVSDGAKSDVGNITEIFSRDNMVMIPDPVYPVYMDTNVMDGRKIIFADANKENNFLAMPDGRHADMIYLCSPNNPCGSVYSKEQLRKWVDYALDNKAVILFDAAYEAFITNDTLPRSIFEIEGAEKCAIEFCSFSKLAGFTGTRCAYTVIKKDLMLERFSLHDMWVRRQSTKLNGVSYVIQRAAEAVFTDEGMEQCKKNIKYYLDNAKLISALLKEKGIYHTGGTNSPYIWMNCPSNMKSWEFFDLLLNKTSVVGTPGSGFGMNGEGYFRLTSFGSRDNTIEAVERIRRVL